MKLRRGPSETELDAELSAYLELAIHENIRAGMSPEAARRAALLQIEGMTQVKERCREACRFHWFTGLAQDVRCAIRNLARHPGFTAAAALSLALGIGANAAIFSVFYRSLIQPLPYPDSAQLVFIGRQITGGMPFIVSQEFAGWNGNAPSLDGVAAWSPDDENLTAPGQPERIHVAAVSSKFLATLGLHPAAGRDFMESDSRSASSGAALLTDAFFRRRFGAKSSAIGASITLDGRQYTIAGVLPAGFRFPGDGDVDLLIALTGPGFQWSDRRSIMVQVIGKLHSGAMPQKAAADLQAITQRNRAEIPPFFQDALLHAKPIIVPLQERLNGSRRPALAALLGAVCLLLLIACANVANLQVARISGRQREIGLRVALGASRVRLARWLIVENLTLSAIAGGLGIGAANGTLALLAHAPGIAVAGPGDLRTGWVVWAACAILSTIAGLAATIVPPLAGPRLQLNETLKSGGSSVAGLRRTYLRPALVAAQVAVALCLLVGAGLLLRSLQQVLAVDFGFRTENMLTAKMRLQLSHYPDVARREQFTGALLERVRALPGVESAAATSALPLSDYTLSGSVLFEGRPEPPPPRRPNVPVSVVSADYFHTMGIPAIAGRTLSDEDFTQGAAFAVVNQAFVDRFYPDGRALGKRIRLYGAPEYTEIVGVVGNVRHRGREAGVSAELFVPWLRFPNPNLDLVVHTKTDPLALATAVRETVWSLDRELPVYDVQTMNSLVSESGGHRRTQTLLLAAFGLLALCLAAVGIYGVVSEAVGRRTREIGVRMALGAQTGEVMRIVLWQSMALAVCGVAAGLGASFYLTRFLESLLFGVKATDTASFVAASALLLAVALVAGYVPARRASRIDPAAVLRSE
ncbi:MAG: ABC transporter permease [Bryobacteraceae bacterium]|jgi:putative ABC transport system permease protein